MAAIVWQDVLDFGYTKMSSVPSNAQTLILEFVNVQLRLDLLGGDTSAKAKIARILYAAHFGELSLRALGKSKGDATEETIADASMSVVYAQQSAAELATTVPGAAYLRLVKNSAARLPFVSRRF